MKTGTPPRLAKDSINYDVIEEQPGDDDPQPFSLRTDRLQFPFLPQLSCYLTYTDQSVHSILEKGFDVSVFEAGGKNREKICGDGFSSDAVNAIRELGIFDEFLKEAYISKGFSHYSFRNKLINFDFDLYMLQRSIFDQILRDRVKSLGGKVLYNSKVNDIAIGQAKIACQKS